MEVKGEDEKCQFPIQIETDLDIRVYALNVALKELAADDDDLIPTAKKIYNFLSDNGKQNNNKSCK